MSATVDSGLLSGFSVGLRNDEELLVPHLLFEYDTLIFYKANHEHICHFRCLFFMF
jgi:hypothetical protein